VTFRHAKKQTGHRTYVSVQLFSGGWPQTQTLEASPATPFVVLEEFCGIKTNLEKRVYGYVRYSVQLI
jgi:hypothetical protein